MAKKKESKQKKMNVRVDFTPMVDMMMLLITFFMLCTSLAKPQAMKITMPAKNNDQIDKEKKESVETKELINIYICPDNKLYTYIIPEDKFFGDEKYLEEVSFGKGGNGVKSIREALIRYNPYSEKETPVQAVMRQKALLQKWEKEQPRANKEVTDSIYQKALNMISKGYPNVVTESGLNKALYEEILRKQLSKTENPEDLNPTIKVNIKPLDNCTYENLVAILDEMTICCIGG